jgi:soluble lytic murein transglycosylase
MSLPAALGLVGALALDHIGPAADTLTLAARTLAAGRPWHASQLLAPLLQDSTHARRPDVVLLAARAAAAWQGWAVVIRLLADQPWLDHHTGGLGRALLAQAAVERDTPDAIAHAARAVSLAADLAERGRRLVILARGLERAGEFDSAAATYRRAAAALPTIAEWLWLRAAGAESDSSTRAQLYARLTLPHTTARVRWAEALALERRGDFAASTRLYTELGASMAAFRARHAGLRTDTERSTLRRDLLAALPTLPAEDVAAALDLLDRLGPLAAPEELAVARRAAQTGLDQRAAASFARAAAAGLLSDSDRLARGMVLARLGRHTEAIAQFDRVGGRLQGQAQYQRARSLRYTGPATRARTALRIVRDSFSHDTATATAAGWLYADALVDAGDDAEARRAFILLARRYPTTVHGERAAFQAALLAFVQRDPGTAATEFDAIADRSVPGAERTAALYWAGRAWEAAGDSLRARSRYRTLIEQYPRSYYVVPAATRLGRVPWPQTPTASGGLTALPQALVRAALLDSLGLTAEATGELDAFVDRAGEAPTAIVEAAAALASAGHAARSIRLALRAQERATADNPVLPALLFPVFFRELIETEARAASADPLLVAAVIRQESLFDPRARSRADARGLMQVRPATGAGLARTEGFHQWDPVLLYHPEVNLRLGIRYLAGFLQRYPGNSVAALAAYNAGPTAVRRWLNRAGTTDPEILIERIPYVETRDYVRRVLFTAARYRSLYGDSGGTGPRVR